MSVSKYVFSRGTLIDSAVAKQVVGGNFSQDRTSSPQLKSEEATRALGLTSRGARRAAGSQDN